MLMLSDLSGPFIDFLWVFESFSVLVKPNQTLFLSFPADVWSTTVRLTGPQLLSLFLYSPQIVNLNN